MLSKCLPKMLPLLLLLLVGCFFNSFFSTQFFFSSIQYLARLCTNSFNCRLWIIVKREKEEGNDLKKREEKNKIEITSDTVLLTAQEAALPGLGRGVRGRGTRRRAQVADCCEVSWWQVHIKSQTQAKGRLVFLKRRGAPPPFYTISTDSTKQRQCVRS